MSAFLFIILMIFVAILFFGVSFISAVVRLFTKGSGSTGNRYSNTTGKRDYSNNEQAESHHENSKVFRKDEGEYVDFEEIK